MRGNQLFQRHTLCQPAAVFGAKKPDSSAEHLAAVYYEHHRRAVSETDQFGCFDVLRQVYIESRLRDQAICQNTVPIFSARSMVQQLQRFVLIQLYVHLDGMPLVSTDFGLVFMEGIALIIIDADDFIQFLHVQRVLQRHTTQQRVVLLQWPHLDAHHAILCLFLGAIIGIHVLR